MFDCIKAIYKQSKTSNAFNPKCGACVSPEVPDFNENLNDTKHGFNSYTALVWAADLNGGIRKLLTV